MSELLRKPLTAEKASVWEDFGSSGEPLYSTPVPLFLPPILLLPAPPVPS